MAVMHADAVTQGTLLDGRIPYRQFRDGYRTGIEPVLLAAAVPARAGDRVLEAGCGAGAGLLCLGARVSGLAGAGVEQDPDTALLARQNLDANCLHDWPVLVAPIGSDAVRELPGTAGRFDHAMANPPWHRDDATASPSATRDLARRAPPGALAAWTGSLARLLTQGGTLTLALPAALHAQASTCMMEAGLGTIRLLPLWPRPDRPARIILLQGVLGGRGDGAILPGLVLHHPGGGFTPQAEAILRGGAGLTMRPDGSA